MRRFLRCLIPLLMVPCLLAFFAFALPPRYSSSFLGAFADKVAAMKAAKGKRVLITGGSGAAFALRSDLLEQELPGYAVINLGMYAGLGSTVPLDAAVPEIRSGDVVLFMPEISEQTLSLYFGASSMWQAADGHWDLLRSVRPENLRALLGQFPYFAAQKAWSCLTNTPFLGDGIYTREAFNQWGDIAGDLRGQNTMPQGYDPNMPVAFPDTLPTDDLIARLQAVHGLCRDRGAGFYFCFGPVNSAAVTDPDAVIQAWEKRLRERLDCPVLLSAQGSLMDPGWFFDTNFHLNSAGAVCYTASLAAELKEALQIKGDVSIAVPAMPEAAGIRPEPSADTGLREADPDCFLYVGSPDGWHISGLSEEGLKRRALTVPSQYDLLPVTGMEPSVFAGNSLLESVTFRKGIRALPDRAFDGCTNLREIILRDIEPSACSVGQELLTGTHADILVNPDLVAAYRTNYFWSVYAPRVRAAQEIRDPDSRPTPTAAAAPAAPVQPPEDNHIRFMGNGGTCPSSSSVYTDMPFDANHLRTNTLQTAFARPGAIQVGWNTQSGGSGKAVGLGSRITPEPGLTLYAQWAEESEPEHFNRQVQDQEVWITGWTGTDDPCVIPAQLDGVPVAGICTGAFAGSAFRVLVVPPSVREIQPDAFAGSRLETLYLYDSLETVSDASFSSCPHLTTLHLNAATPPRYSISYYATFADKYDRLLSLAEQKDVHLLVLFSGSSTRYGYDSPMLQRYYPLYQVVNMGVYAYTNALPQMDLIRNCMRGGDVLLHAPEFDCLNFQMCENNKLDFHFWAMMEANYDCVAQLDLKAYSRVFDSLGQYLAIRRDLPERSCTETPNGYDDDGNNMRMPTYNEYGDFIMPRANNKVDIMLKYVRAEYTPAPFTQERLDSLNAEYRKFLDAGVQVLFTYTPRNRSSISEDSTPENRMALEALLKEKLCVPVISRMEDSLISGVYFFVIDSHLSSEGVRLHTLQIIRDLEPWLQP